MLKIDNLHASVAGKEILKGLSLDVKPGQVHAIMGPNGAGKSTLGNILAGREGYEVTAGTVEFEGKPLLELEPEERAAAGVFLAFQYPVEIPGVNNTYFLRAALNAQRKARGEAELDSMQFLKLVREKLAVLHLKDELLHRGVNEGFSGGEKKRNEIFQLALLEPKLAILDETDSLNAQRKARGEAELDSMQFLKLVREKLAVLHLKDELLHRGVNEGFSGGEKKRNEIFQLAVLEPKLAILDETDSGLDIDALKSVAEGVNALRSPDRAFLVITHYQRLLDYIKPDVVHVLANGRIVESGGPELALELEEHGYAWIKDRVAPEKVA
jgi:FeS assembly ATPase SufC